MSTIGMSLAEAWWMFYDTFWALVLGFGLSGVVQAFVSKRTMQRQLGDHRPRTLVKASFFGAVSSSCSYAASALGKSLFARGADFTASMTFMFASTNLVLELGVVLWLLIGWQFAAAELVGGAVMIVLLGLALPRVVPEGELVAVRERLDAGTAGGEHEHDGGQETSGRAKARTAAGWSDAASYTISDLTMLRKELVIGFVVAGFAAMAVPTSVWQALFLTDHGLLSTVENVVVGPVLAFLSFVCSVGNVPLAAALWKGGISFGGVVSFIFADLLTIPLILIYRRFYGTRVMVRLALTFWAVMATAGLVTEGVFAALGLLPGRDLSRDIATTHVGWNYTTLLNLLAAVAFAGLLWLHRNRARFGGGEGLAIDPVCGMQVRTSDAPATAERDGHTVFFCSDRCHDAFVKDPERYAGRGAAMSQGHGHDDGHDHDHHRSAYDGASATDPICGMTVDPGAPGDRAEHDGRTVFFCGPGCRDAFLADPAAHPVSEARAVDPVCGMSVDAGRPGATAEHDGRTVFFCGPGCRDAFVADPERFAQELAR